MSIETELNRIKEAKTAIGTSIGRKGVQVPADAMIDAYPGLIDQIQTGGKVATLEEAKLAGYSSIDQIPISPDRQKTIAEDISKMASVSGDWQKRGKKWGWGTADKRGVIYGPKVDLSVITNDDEVGPIYSEFPDLEYIPEYEDNVLKRFPMVNDTYNYLVGGSRDSYLIYNCPKLKHITSFTFQPGYSDNGRGVYLIDSEHLLNSRVAYQQTYILYWNSTKKPSELKAIDTINFENYSTWCAGESSSTYPCDFMFGYNNGNDFDSLEYVGGIPGFAGNLFMGSYNYSDCPNLTKESWENIANSVADLRERNFMNGRVYDSGINNYGQYEPGTGGHLCLGPHSMKKMNSPEFKEIKDIFLEKKWVITDSTY